MPLTANFLADFSSFLTATENSIQKTKELETAAATVGPALDTSLKTAGTALETTAEQAHKFGVGIGTALRSQELRDFGASVIKVAGDFIQEFTEAEAATARLNQALVNSGQTAPEVGQAYADMATELQRMSTFSGDAVTAAQTLLTTVGNIKADNMKEVLKATMDLATGLGVDLTTAANLVAKAAASDGEQLGRLKTVLGDTIPEGAKFADVLAAINAKFGGQAAAAIQTTAGQMANLKNRMADINEQVGEQLAGVLNKILDVFQALPEEIQTVVVVFGAVGTALAPVITAFASLVSLLVSLGVGAGLWAGIVAGFEAILPFLGPVGWIAAGLIALFAVWKNWDTITAYVSGAYNAVKTWLGDKLGALFEWIGTQVTNAIAFFKGFSDKVIQYWGLLLPFLGPAGLIVAGLAAVFAAWKNWDAIVAYVKGVYEGIKTWLGDKLGALFNYVAGLPGIVISAFQNMYNALIGFSFVPDTVDGIAKQFGRLDRIMVDPALAAIDDVTRAFAGMRINPITVPGAAGGLAGGATRPINVSITMSGMMGTDDPQTRAMLRSVVSDALMDGMRGARLLGTA